jgi:hypothetical protein
MAKDPELRTNIYKLRDRVVIEKFRVQKNGTVHVKRKLLSKKLSESIEIDSKRGFPQGVNFSPILSTLALSFSGLTDQFRGNFYADDGILY